MNFLVVIALVWLLCMPANLAVIMFVISKLPDHYDNFGNAKFLVATGPVGSIIIVGSFLIAAFDEFIDYAIKQARKK